MSQQKPENCPRCSMALSHSEGCNECRGCGMPIRVIGKMFAERAASNTGCPRCGDMFYHPKTVIEDYRQRSAEWEEIATKAEAEVVELKEKLRIFEKHCEKGAWLVGYRKEKT